MKTRLLLYLLLMVPVFGQVTVKKPVHPAPGQTRPQAVSANPTAKIEAAVRPKVQAYFINKTTGSGGLRVISSSVKITATEPVAGWTGRWRCSGQILLTLAGGAGNSDHSPALNFEAVSIVSDNGAIEVVDISG